MVGRQGHGSHADGDPITSLAPPGATSSPGRSDSCSEKSEHWQVQCMTLDQIQGARAEPTQTACICHGCGYVQSKFIQLSQEVWGCKVLLMALTMCLGVFSLKMPTRKHIHLSTWDTFTWSLNQPGDQPQKIVSLMG